MDSMTLDFGHSDDYLNQNDALLDSSMDLEYILDYSGLNLDQDQDQNLTTRYFWLISSFFSNLFYYVFRLSMLF